MTPINCEAAMRHGQAEHVVTFLGDNASFLLCDACTTDALVNTPNIKVTRIIR